MAEAKEKVMTRSSSWAIKTPFKEESKGWKPKKDKSTPDLGTYEHHKSKDKMCKEDHPNYSMPKSKQLKFTTEYAKNKGFVPAANHYKVEKCYNVISRPYMRKR
jgi:hypothetical protein